MYLRISYIYTINVYFKNMVKHNKKYQQIISTGKDLFWKFGIKRVTIEEICAEASVSKMTFYKFFSNKTELVKHIIDLLYDNSLKEYKSIIDSNKDYKEKVTDMALLKIKGTNDISHEFLNDYYSLIDNELSGYLKKKFDHIMEVMLEDFTIAQKNGDIRSDIKPEFIMYFLNNMITMAGDPQLNKNYPNAQDMIMELLNFFFYGVLPRDEKNMS